MTRGVLLLSVSLAALGGASMARVQDLRDLQAQNAAAHALEDVRRDLLSSQLDASSANERGATEMRLRGLETQRTAPSLGPLTVSHARPIDTPGRREAELSASASRLERLTRDALAESNARMRAIRPASQR